MGKRACLAQINMKRFNERRHNFLGKSSPEQRPSQNHVATKLLQLEPESLFEIVEQGASVVGSVSIGDECFIATGDNAEDAFFLLHPRSQENRNYR